MERLVIFDVDDVMWDLNRKVSELTRIPYEKFTHFSIYENPDLMDYEKQYILDVYNDPETFKNICFKTAVIDLINRIYWDYPRYPVHIVSNCGSRIIKDSKMDQLLEVLDLPEERIHLKQVDLEADHKTKELPDNIYIIVDDSPYNIVRAKAVHKIMPARPHNNVKLDCFVERPKTDDELVDAVMWHIDPLQ